MLTDRSNICYW